MLVRLRLGLAASLDFSQQYIHTLRVRLRVRVSQTESTAE